MDALHRPDAPAGGYFTLKNSGGKARDLVKASSPGCGMLMLHRSIEKDGAMKMIGVGHVTVPAKGTVSFTPGGYHLMCMKPTEAVRPGKKVPVTLTFKDGATMTVDFPVRNAAGK